jgi:hypothetical protein
VYAYTQHTFTQVRRLQHWDLGGDTIRVGFSSFKALEMSTPIDYREFEMLRHPTGFLSRVVIDGLMARLGQPFQHSNVVGVNANQRHRFQVHDGHEFKFFCKD